MAGQNAELEKRLDDLEVKVAFQEKNIDDLNQALIDEAQRAAQLEAEISVLKEAVRRLSTKGQDPEVLGTLPEEDPVPESG
jgi:uncharacterized coiled-coil protein SlyX